ncbi:MAG TPA: nickel pincer cofactor biosynthesis protein LarC [Actinomycetota bacterium]
MSRILYVDPIGGAAGDMLLAALLDAGAPEAAVREAVDAVLPGRFAFSTEPVRRGGTRAQLLRIRHSEQDGADTSDGSPRSFRQLMEALDAAPLPEGVARRARMVLSRLGEGESAVHGIPSEELELHELGDADTLLDVVGVAAALEWLEVADVRVGSIPLGSGGAHPRWRGHPEMPLPAPVTVELLRGFDVRAGGSEETVTPTAAAVFAALGRPAEGLPEMRLDAVGYGAGNRDPKDRPNVVRVILGSPSSDLASAEPDRVRERMLTVLEANVDDLSPELVADAMEALLAAGALDAWTAPIQMKKGRPGLMISALCDPQDEQGVGDVFFEATSTFGVRGHQVRRSELERRSVAVDLADGSVRVKVGLLGGRVVSATPEHDDVADLARRVGRPVRQVYEEAVAAAAALRVEAPHRA